MSCNPNHRNDPTENDAVWKLLAASPQVTAGPRFADETVRLARLERETRSWWNRWFAPAPLAGLAAAAAVAVVIATTSLLRNDPAAPVNTAAETAAFSEIQELAETEILLSAVDHLDQFSDSELVSLIGF